jgi:hypothetical protein
MGQIAVTAAQITPVGQVQPGSQMIGFMNGGGRLRDAGLMQKTGRVKLPGDGQAFLEGDVDKSPEFF